MLHSATVYYFQPSTSKNQQNAPLAKNSYLGIYALDQVNKFWGEKYITHVLKPCFLTEHMEVYMFPHTVVKWLIDLQSSCSFWMCLMLHCLCNSETITSGFFFWAGSSISLCAAGVGLSLCCCQLASLYCGLFGEQSHHKGITSIS